MKKLNKFLVLPMIFAAGIATQSCSDDSSSIATDEVTDSTYVDKPLAAIFNSDFKSGELRIINEAGISEESFDFYMDSKLATNNNMLYIIERMGADNITKIDLAKLNNGIKSAILWQIALDDGSNPLELAFGKDFAWVALQAADSLVKISTENGKILKSIKTSTFNSNSEISPYTADIKLQNDTLYVLMQRYSIDVSTRNAVYPAGLLAIYDANTCKLLDTLQLKAKNPTAIILQENAIYVASQGEYNANYGTDADSSRGIELVDLQKKTTKFVITGNELGGGVYSIVAENGTAFAAIYKSFGDVPLAKIDLKNNTVQNVAGIYDAEGSLSLNNGNLYIGNRSYENEKVYILKSDNSLDSLNSPKGMLPPYSIVQFY